MNYKFLVLSAIMLAGCTPSNNSTYETTSKAKWESSKIEIHWVSKDEISDVCKSMGTGDGSGSDYNGCARSKPADPNVCEIYAVQPESFDDSTNLAILGHETWHCLGATHK
jgi:hypothetical protein